MVISRLKLTIIKDKRLRSSYYVRYKKLFNINPALTNQGK